jgi:predicted permease
MRTLREWVLRFWGTLTGRRRDRELEEELRLHLELAAEEAQRRGLSPDAAARATAIASGGHVHAIEALRDQRGVAWLDDLTRDVRHGIRALRRSPVFTAVALLTLALGIGANTAIFTIVNGVILRPLAYPAPEQLTTLTTNTQELSQPEYLALRDGSRFLVDVGAYIADDVNLTEGDRALRVRAATVDGHLLSALGVEAAQGRLFARGETDVSGPWFPGNPENPQPPLIAILSHELWQAAFGGRAVIGERVEVNRRRYEVIGIMPPGVDLMDDHIEIWLPLGLNPAQRVEFRGFHFLNVIGRLKDGITVQTAQTELNAVMENWGERLDVPFAKHVADGHIQLTPMHDAILGSASRSIWVLQASVGLVLLIACANLANLLLARAETRRRELAVRAALGAGRGRLVRQFMTEGLLLSLAGGGLGLWLADLGVDALLRAYPGTLPRASDVAIDLPVLLFTLGISSATGVLFGLAPIAHVRARDLVTALKDAGTRGGTAPMHHHVRRGLVITEVAFAVMLVISAGLLVRTAYNLTNVDPGFDRARLVTFSVTSISRARGQTYLRLLDSLRALPGVQAATGMSGLPPNRPSDGEDMQINNYVDPGGDRFPGVDYFQNVMSNYFETMGIPIVAGRGFHPTDAASSGMVAVVNETLANKFWKGENPIGQQLRPPWGDWVPMFTVVGVARDVKQGGIDRETGTEFYFFVEQMANAPDPLGRAPVTLNVVLRTTLPPSALSRAIDRAVHEADPTVAVAGLREMSGVFAAAISRPRLLAQLIGAFAGLALALAAIGTYGLLSYVVAERRREIGIRMALGAPRSRVLAQIMQQGLQLAAMGLVAGLAGALGLNRLIASMLFGIQSTDPATIAAVIATIAIVAAFACWLPAFRASRLDPNVVLRTD